VLLAWLLAAACAAIVASWLAHITSLLLPANAKIKNKDAFKKVNNSCFKQNGFAGDGYLHNAHPDARWMLPWQMNECDWGFNARALPWQCAMGIEA
jgi:hypothetical protein